MGNAVKLQATANSNGDGRCPACRAIFPLLARRRQCGVCHFTFCVDCVGVVSVCGRVDVATGRPLVTAKSAVRACRRCQVLSNPNFNYEELVSLKARDLVWFLRRTGTPCAGLKEKDQLADLILEQFGNASLRASRAANSRRVVRLAASLDRLDDDGDGKDDDGEFVERRRRKSTLSLSDLRTEDELEQLSVKDLKLLLAKNFVDYRGCLERQELSGRLRRLWRDHRASREALRSGGFNDSDLCKICMDAAIDCVLLECGHMICCVACGKRCSECPLCRQFVVRVVRTFKA